MRRALVVTVFLLALAAPSVACAQARAGLALATLRAGLERSGLTADPSAPSDATGPVRVAIRRGQASVALLDVRVLGDQEAARAWLEAQSASASTHALHARSPELVTDTESGSAGIALAAHGGVALAVRSIDSSLDALAILAVAIEAIDSAGAVGTISVAPIVVGADLPVGESVSVQEPAGAIALRVTASGGGYARRTPRGWMITRTGPEPIAARMIVVDGLLRVID